MHIVLHVNLADLTIQIYGAPEQARSLSFGANNAPTRTDYAARAPNHGALRTAGRASVSSASHVPTMPYNYQGFQACSLTGVPESVSVQEMAFRQGRRDSSSLLHDAPATPFPKQFDQLWAAFYKLGKECGGQRTPTPVNTSLQNFAWPVLINPYTQSLKHPNGSLDPVWSRKMIQAALNCMQELIRITCRRNTGWDKTVADIPLPAQEALAAFPDLAQQYEQLKRDAKEARSGGRPYGY